MSFTWFHYHWYHFCCYVLRALYFCWKVCILHEQLGFFLDYIPVPCNCDIFCHTCSSFIITDYELPSTVREVSVILYMWIPEYVHLHSRIVSRNFGTCSCKLSLSNFTHSYHHLHHHHHHHHHHVLNIILFCGFVPFDAATGQFIIIWKVSLKR